MMRMWGQLGVLFGVVLAAIAGGALASGQEKPPAIQVTGATYLDVDDVSGQWQLRGNPVVVTRGARTMRAAFMRYDSLRQILYASDSARFDDDTSELRAAMVTAFFREDRVVAEGGVVAVSRDRGRETTVRGARLELWSAERRALATGSVILERGEVTVTGERLEYDVQRQQAVATGQPRVRVPQGTVTADRIEVQLDRDELTAEGAVHLVSGSLEGSAPKVMFQRAQGLATLSGGATVRQGRNEVRAEVLTVDLQRQRIVATGQAHLVVFPTP